MSVVYEIKIPSTCPPIHVHKTGQYTFESQERVYQWIQHDCTQEYKGTFLHCTEHGEGDYTWDHNGNIWHYKGHFYANHLESYGKLTYPDSTTFEGLWHRNFRYGPGVHTQANGRQNVGLWKGTRLARLSTPVEGVPRLGTNTESKIRLLKYRKLVPIKEGDADLATAEIMKLGCGENVLERSHELYCSQIREPASLAFNRPLYEETFFRKMPIEAEAQNEIISTDSDSSIKKIEDIEATHLVAWNNNDNIIDMLQHIFKHRHFEQALSYRMDWLMCAQRDQFVPAGEHESACLELLSCSLENRTTTMSWLLDKVDLNIDVTDARGNSAMMYAAAADAHEAIDILLDHGANVNYLNDEGFTPLSLCLTRYLAIIQKVEDWGDTFLPTGKPDNVKSKLWRPRTSDSKMASEYNFQEDLQEKEHVPKATSDAKPKKMSKTVKESSKYVQEQNEREEEERERLEKISQTIAKLLKRGADPNFCEVPRKTLEMAVHAMNPTLVEVLLKYGADPNTRSHKHDGGLSVLHIIFMKEPCQEMEDIVKLLLSHGADPNITVQEESDEVSFKELWPDKTLDIAFYGARTPLHVASMRSDIQEESGKHLEAACHSLAATEGTDLNTLYMGLTPLCWAILNGNDTVVRALLSTNYINPNELLPHDLGVPLAFLFSSTCINKLSPEIIMNMCNILCTFGADPLHLFALSDGFYGNVVDYVHRESEKRMRQQSEARDLPKNSKSKGRRKVHPKSNISNVFTTLLQRLTELASTRLIRHIKSSIVQQLIAGIRRKKDSRTIQFAKMWINSDDVIKCLELLMKNQRTDVNKEEAEKMLFFIAGHNAPKESYLHRLDVLFSFSETQIMKINTVNYSKQYPFALEPELDTNVEKFIVCFECIRKYKQVLLPCPNCKMVFFCSDNCNGLNNTRESPHTCGTDFYRSARKIYDKILADESRIGMDHSTDRIFDKLSISDDKWYRDMRISDMYDETDSYEEDILKKVGKLTDLEQFEDLKRKKKDKSFKQDIAKKVKKKKDKDDEAYSEEGKTEKYEYDTDERLREKKELRKKKQKHEDEMMKKKPTEKMEDESDDLKQIRKKQKDKTKGKYEDESDDDERVDKKQKEKKPKEKMEDELDDVKQIRKKQKEKKRKGKHEDESDDVEQMGKQQKGKKLKGKYEDESDDVKQMDKRQKGKKLKEKIEDDERDRRKKKDKTKDFPDKRDLSDKIMGMKKVEAEQKYRYDKGKEGNDGEKRKVDEKITTKLAKRLQKTDKLKLLQLQIDDGKINELKKLFQSIDEQFLLDMYHSDKFIMKDFLLPYTVYRDGNLYYRVYGPRPTFIENYSFN